jgi:hypothetical protein
MDEYLPEETLAWCHKELALYGIGLKSLSAADIDQREENAGARLHIRAYSHLRSIVRRHISTGAVPHLTMCPDLTGGYDRVAEFGGPLQEIIEQNAEFVRRGREIDTQLAAERDEPGQFEENELLDDFMIDD